MTLYESNYIRLGWLVDDLRALDGVRVSQVTGDCPLKLALLERGPYTTTVSLTYLFDDGTGPVEDPALEVRVYHDARLAEARTAASRPAHAGLRQIRELALRAAPQAARDPKWTRNVMLNKWLEYCADRGHRFSPTNA